MTASESSASQKQKEYKRQYYLAHREELLARQHRYAKANKEAIAEYTRKWRANNPEKRAAQSARYNAKRKAKRARERLRKEFAQNPASEWTMGYEHLDNGDFNPDLFKFQDGGLYG